MKKLSIIFMIMGLLGCQYNNYKTATQSSHYSTVSYQAVTQDDLQILLNAINNNTEYNHISLNIEKFGDDYILTDYGSGIGASDIYFRYFFKKDNHNKLYLDKIIGRHIIYGVMNYLIVENINKPFTPDVVDMGGELEQKISHNFKNLVGDIGHSPYIRAINLFVDYQLQIAYFNDEQVLNFSPDFIVKNNNKTLTTKTPIWVGYDYQDLTTPKFVAIEKEDKFVYFHHNEMDKLGEILPKL